MIRTADIRRTVRAVTGGVWLHSILVSDIVWNVAWLQRFTLNHTSVSTFMRLMGYVP